ncbi:MAG: exonuclease SbcCD subunit D [Lachnospiraceae bacterium]
MKLLHMADLHIGKRVNGFSMLEEQRQIFAQVIEIVQRERPDGILIAGDVYDKSQPSAEAVELLDEFLTNLTKQGKPIFMISGNHDSPERLGFGSRIMEKNGVFIAGVYNGTIQSEVLQDEYGPVHIYLLPFMKPAMLKPFFEEPIESYEEAVRLALSTAEIQEQDRNVLIAHQYVTSGAQQPEQSDSESLSIGGLENVDAEAFSLFDYVALGHLHGPQRMSRDTIRYAGSPIKYSFSEAGHQKSVTLLELGEKGEIGIQLLPLTPIHDMRTVKGPIEELLKIGNEEPEGAEDYIQVILTDEEEIYDALGKLRQVYPNLMALNFENSRSKRTEECKVPLLGESVKKSPMELFSQFYKGQNQVELSREQIQVMEDTIRQAGGQEE